MVCKKAFKNKLLACLCVLLVFVCLPLPVQAQTVSGGDFKSYVLSESIYNYDIMTMSESEILSLAEKSTADFTYRNLNGNASVPLYLDNYTFTEDGGSVVASYSGNLTIPIMLYNNGTVGVLHGELLRKYSCRVTSVTTGATVAFHNPTIIDSSVPDGTSLRYNLATVPEDYERAFEFGLACDHIQLSSVYSGYVTIQFTAALTSDSSEFFGSSYKYIVIYVKESTDFYGAYNYETGVYPSDSSAERIQTELLYNIKQYTQPLAGYLSDIKAAISHFHTDLVANMQVWFTDIMNNINDLKNRLLYGSGSGSSTSISEGGSTGSGGTLQEQQNQLQSEGNALQEEANETQKNIFDKIADFFDNFFSRLGDFLLGLIVPSAEELTAFLDEVNDWFGERLGFIWYPFSFAVDMVSALANGTADTGFQVPEFRLNILGTEYQIWAGMTVDLDAFGIFKYVRIFTSFLLVGGIVKLAYDKWDEWIGGHGVG